MLLVLAAGVSGQEALTRLKVISEMANIRLRPDIGSIIIHQVPEGTTLEATAKEEEWFAVKIKTDEGEEASGYIHESTVIVIERSPALKIITKPEKKPEPEAEKAEKPEKTIAPPEIKRKKPFPPPGLPEAPPTAGDLCFMGGGSYVMGGDLNSGARGFVDYYRYSLRLEGQGNVSPLHLSYIYGGELAFSVGSSFSVGAGLDYLQGESQSRVEFSQTPASAVLTHPKIQAFPIRLYVSYQPLPFFYVKTGIEYYFAQCEYLYRYQDGDDWLQHEGKARKRASGILAAAGLDFRLGSWASLILEVTGRTAKISGFKGTNRLTDSAGAAITEEGLLYFYLGKTTDVDSFPLLFIKKNKPSEDIEIAEPRLAVIDFSGVSLKAGLKLRF